VTTVIDNSVESVCVLLGLWQAGLDTLLLEHTSSYLADTGSAVWTCGATALVGPAEVAGQEWRGLGTRLSYLDLLADAGQLSRPDRTAEREPSVLQLTSGSTGEPRIAVHPLANIVRGGLLYRDIHQVSEADVIVVPLPLAHSFGLVGGLMMAICSGAEADTMRRLLLGRLIEAVSRPGAIVLGTPLLYRLATAASVPAVDLGANGQSPAKSALCSGGPLPPEIGEAARNWLGCRLSQVYGSTETGLISCECATDRLRPRGSVGRPAPGVTVRFTDPPPDSADLRSADGAAAVFELWVRTTTMCAGYLDGDSPLTDGFFRTGDLGAMDGEGRLYLAGRKATFINVGGRKVSAARLERLVRGTGMVTDVAVYGVDRGQGDEEIHAAIELAPGFDLQQVRARCSGLFSNYEIPHAFHVLAQLPRGPLGKVQRERLPR